MHKMQKQTEKIQPKSGKGTYSDLFSPPALKKKRPCRRRRGANDPDFFGPVETSRKALIKSKAPVCRSPHEEAYLQAYELYEAYPHATDAILTALSEAQIAREGRRGSR